LSHWGRTSKSFSGIVGRSGGFIPAGIAYSYQSSQ
jgi:hypothetical protein